MESSPEHCDDQRLMAYIHRDLPDGELVRVEGHLALCWECSQRRWELEQKLQEIRETLDDHQVLKPRQIERARGEFFSRYAALDAEIEEQRAKPLFGVVAGRKRSAFGMRLAIAAAVLLACGTFAWFQTRAPAVATQEVLAQTLQRESVLLQLESSVHQEFQIDIEQVAPERQTRTGTLRVWFDSGGKRFASRWERQNGELQYAVWRPEPGREYVYNARLGSTAVARTPEPRQDITLGEVTFEEATLEQLEQGFLFWLANRPWEPISFASDVNVFRRRDGVAAEVERISSPDCESCYRVTARRETDWGTLELVAEVDAETYKPNIELLRLTTDERTVELRLRVCRTQWLTAGMVESDLFWPSVRIEGGDPRIAAARLPEAGPTEARPAEPPPVALPSKAELDLAEIQAQYALHQAGACLGVPIRIERDQPGVVRVQGLVESPQRKQELLSHLAETPSADLLRIEISTVEEALRSASSDATAKWAAGRAQPPEISRHADETLEVVASGSPIKSALERYLRQAAESGALPVGSDKAEDLQQMVVDISQRVLSGSLANLTEAWALRKLAERYGSASGNALPGEASPLIRDMLVDHLAALKERSAGIEEQVRPLLLTLVTRDATPKTSPDGLAAPDWATHCLRIFQEVEAAESATTQLFADSGNADGQRHLASAEDAALALLSALPHLTRRLEALEQHLPAREVQFGGGASN